MSLAEHLYELRNRLAKSFLAIGLGMVVVGLVVYQPVFDFLREPYCRTSVAGHACNLYVRDIFSQFAVRLKVAGIGGTVLAAPVWLYQLGAFITPALHRKEKRYAAGFLAASLVLFGTGVLFAYLTMDKGLQFLLTVGGDGLVTLPDLQSYLSFVTLTLLAFGIAFEMPIFVLALVRLGVLSAEKLRRNRRIGYVAMLAFAILLPTVDPVSLTLEVAPLLVLYELSIWVAVVMERRWERSAAEAL
jgi:sec-independent protein translocase protein TatC